MKILMLTCNSSLQDGINRHILTVAPAVNKIKGFKVAVCTTSTAGDLNRALESNGVLCFALGLANGHSLKTWCRFRKVLRNYCPDLIHVHVIGLFQRLFLGLFYRTLPVVSTCHGITDVEIGIANRSFRDIVESLLYQIIPYSVSKTIFISRGVAVAKGSPHGIVAYNPIDFSINEKEGHHLHHELKLLDSVPIIGTSCRISHVKRPLYFVKVMCKVLQEIQECHAVVCGTSNDKELLDSLRQYVLHSGIGDRFHWLGYRNDAPVITRELDCFIMTSATEGMPTALLEAMSVKTPIAFMQGEGGLIDLFDLNQSEGPIAVVARGGDCDGLSKGIIEILRDKNLRTYIASRAYECGSRYFDANSIAHQIVKIYKLAFHD